MIIINRALAVYIREGRRELCARDHISEENLSNSISHLNAEMPCLDHDRKMLRLPSHGQRPAVHENCDERLSGFHKLREHLSLPAGKCNIRFGGSLPGHGSGLTDNSDDHISVLTCRSQFFFIQISLRSSACIISYVRSGIFKAIQNSDAVLLLPSHCPGTGHFIGRIGKCSHQTDLPVFRKGQKAIVIFEKYNGFLCCLQRKCSVLRRNPFLVSLDHFFGHIGILEETKPDFDTEDPSDCLINDFH